MQMNGEENDFWRLNQIQDLLNCRFTQVFIWLYVCLNPYHRYEHSSW